MQLNTPVYQSFEIDFDYDEGTLYQRICFMHSIIRNSIFTESVEKSSVTPKQIGRRNPNQPTSEKSEELTINYLFVRSSWHKSRRFAVKPLNEELLDRFDPDEVRQLPENREYQYCREMLLTILRK
jgi:hypothetical protein